MVKIGSVELKNNIAAAPLAGYSNPVYRLMCHEWGAGLAVSEMISDKALHYENAKTFDMCRTVAGEHPVSLQLFGGDPVTMAEAAEYLSSHTDCDLIDINMGCPVTKVIKAHAGSYLMAHEDLAVEVAEAVVKHTDKPVTVKMRAGWDKEHINCVSLARRLEGVGVQMIAVHGRTRSQFYTGSSDNTYIRMVKDAVKIPVFGNGDIRTVDDAERMLSETGCDGIMIGRGLLGRPYFLKELLCAAEHKPYTEPTCEERLDLAYDYAKKLCEYESEHTAIPMMRGLSGYYLAGMPGSKTVKQKLIQMNSLAEMKSILDAYKEDLKRSSAD